MAVPEMPGASYIIGSLMGKKHGPSLNVSEETRKTLKQWLSAEGYSITDGTSDGTVWAFSAIEQSGFGVGVSQPTGPATVVNINVTVPLDEYQVQMAKLLLGERTEFLWELRFQLLNMATEFNLQADKPEDAANLPTSVLISQPVYIQGITKDLFFRRILEVRKALLAVQWMFERKFGVPPSLGVTFTVH